VQPFYFESPRELSFGDFFSRSAGLLRGKFQGTVSVLFIFFKKLNLRTLKVDSIPSFEGPKAFCVALELNRGVQMKIVLASLVAVALFSSTAFANPRAECERERNRLSDENLKVQNELLDAVKKCKSNDCLANSTAAPGLEKILELRSKAAVANSSYIQKRDQCPPRPVRTL